MKFLGLLLALALGLLPSSSLVLAQQGNATCYLLNGNPLPNVGTFFPGFAPCTAPGLTSICCATNRTDEPGGDASGDVKDECLPNGLCQNRNRKEGVMTVSYFANHCTDPSYPAGKCLDICPSNRGPGGSSQVTPCSDTADSEMWCCGKTKDCCTTGIGVVRLAQVLGQAISSSAVVVSLSTATSAVSSSASAAATMGVDGLSSSGSGQLTKNKKKGLKGGAIAGIVVGALALLLLIPAILVIRKRRSKAKSDVSTAEVPPPHYYAAEHRVEKDSRGITELETPLSELPGTQARDASGNWPHVKAAELDGGSARRVS